MCASLSSASVSSGASGMTSSVSSLIGRALVRLLDVRDAGREWQQVQWVVGAAIAPDLEMHVVRGRAAGLADRRDRLTGRDPVARPHEVLLVVGVDRDDAVGVRELDDA